MTRNPVLTETELALLAELLRVAQSTMVSWAKVCRQSQRIHLADALEEYASQCSNLIERIERQ